MTLARLRRPHEHHRWRGRCARSCRTGLAGTQRTVHPHWYLGLRTLADRRGSRGDTMMCIHEEIQKAVLPLLEKYDLELIDLIGELNHAAWEISVLNKTGIENLITELRVKP